MKERKNVNEKHDLPAKLKLFLTVKWLVDESQTNGAKLTQKKNKKGAKSERRSNSQLSKNCVHRREASAAEF